MQRCRKVIHLSALMFCKKMTVCVHLLRRTTNSSRRAAKSALIWHRIQRNFTLNPTCEQMLIPHTALAAHTKQDLSGDCNFSFFKITDTSRTAHLGFYNIYFCFIHTLFAASAKKTECLVAHHEWMKFAARLRAGRASWNAAKRTREAKTRTLSIHKRAKGKRKVALVWLKRKLTGLNAQRNHKSEIKTPIKPELFHAPNFSITQKVDVQNWVLLWKEVESRTRITHKHQEMFIQNKTYFPSGYWPKNKLSGVKNEFIFSDGVINVHLEFIHVRDAHAYSWCSSHAAMRLGLSSAHASEWRCQWRFH